jgi:hypothetical protein
MLAQAHSSNTQQPWSVRRLLRVEIFGLLCAKAVMLGLLYFMFFGPGTQVHPDAGAVSAHVYGGVLR